MTDDPETSELLQAAIGKTVASVTPMRGKHWDGGEVEYGVILAFTDGSSIELDGVSVQSEGYILAKWQSRDEA